MAKKTKKKITEELNEQPIADVPQETSEPVVEETVIGNTEQPTQPEEIITEESPEEERPAE